MIDAPRGGPAVRAPFAGLPFLPFALLALFGLGAAAFWPVVTGERSFFHVDLLHEHVPAWDWAARTLRSGAFPAWIDGAWCGHPFLYVQEAPVFYPLTVPILLSGLPAHRAADLFSLLHFWGAGAAMYFLLRRFGGDGAGPLLGAAAWMLGSRTLFSALWPNAVAAAALLPLLVLAAFATRDDPARGLRGSRGAAGLAVATGLLLLLSRPQSLVAAAPLVASVLVAVVAGAEPGGRGRTAARLAAGLSLGLLLGAPAWLPSALLHPEMTRGAGLAPSARDAVFLGGPGAAFAEAFLPPPAGLSPQPEPLSWPGAVPLLLLGAGLALFLSRASRREAGKLPGAELFAAAVLAAVLGLALALGERGPWGLVSSLPVLSGLRVPVRFLLPFGFAAAAGSGLAASWILESRRGRLLPVLALVATAAELLVLARRSAPTAPAGVYRVAPALADRLGAFPPDASGFQPRYWTLGPPLFSPRLGDSGAAELVRGRDRLALSRGVLFGLDAVMGGGPPLLRTNDLALGASLEGARLASATRFVLSDPRPVPGLALDPAAPPGIALAEVPAVLPRARVVPRAVVVRPGSALETLRDPRWRPERAALVEGGEPFDETAAWGGDAGEAHLAARGPGRVELDVRLPARGVLVLADAFEDGWSCRVDGRAAPLLRADHAFRGVLLPAGRHRVSMTYAPRGVRDGFLLALGGVLGCLLLLRRS